MCWCSEHRTLSHRTTLHLLDIEINKKWVTYLITDVKNVLLSELMSHQAENVDIYIFTFLCSGLLKVCHLQLKLWCKKSCDWLNTYLHQSCLQRFLLIGWFQLEWFRQVPWPSLLTLSVSDQLPMSRPNKGSENTISCLSTSRVHYIQT